MSNNNVTIQSKPPRAAYDYLVKIWEGDLIIVPRKGEIIVIADKRYLVDHVAHKVEENRTIVNCINL